ncbi:hypothetical protein A4G26_07635 [Mycobacterium kansasii]|uniref:Transcription factor zinc-finger domain-containing protein n=1 Tax=Mycobacterium innocens TaxID=2341083 RepID=A0A498Q6V3_9MYCO|nr:MULTISPECIES: zf-TFIIB domain-containing protein [Mycobacterium]KZS69043.1 hypothetical protein A4G26_07635 [Mycobacterium kansasii]VBA40709.1 hypothetical protein LAUMK13_03194 [Mycobacterium innocens]
MSDKAMICPRCGSEMETYSRSGINVDRCTGCRGVVPDRGELESLIDAETAYYQQTPPAPVGGYPPGYSQPPPPYPPPSPYYGDYHDDHHGDHGYYGHHGRRGFLHGLFD